MTRETNSTTVSEGTAHGTDGGPAFPHMVRQRPDLGAGISQRWTDGGMSLRAYAAIQLRVPSSGIDWLDDMIRQAKRDEFAGQIAAGMAAYSGTSGISYGPGEIAGRSYQVADAMLTARKAGDT